MDRSALLAQFESLSGDQRELVLTALLGRCGLLDRGGDDSDLDAEAVFSEVLGGAEGVADDGPESFEEALSETQQIVRQLETGELSLDDSLKAYEAGVRRIRQCQQFLNGFEHRVQMLTGFDREGNPILQPFDDDKDMSLEQKQDARGRRRGMTGKKSEPKTDELF